MWILGDALWGCEVSGQVKTELKITVNKNDDIGIEHYSGNKGVMFYLENKSFESVTLVNLYAEDIDKVIDILTKAKELTK